MKQKYKNDWLAYPYLVIFQIINIECPLDCSIIIPVVLINSQHLIAQFEVNAVKGSFLIDTGASNSCIDQELAMRFNLEIEGEELPLTAAGKEKLQAYSSKKSLLSFNQVKLKPVHFILIDMEPINTTLETQGEKGIDGIIGADILQAHQAVLDYGKKELQLWLIP